jgi:cysteine desulfurase / selenocysteine lyase
MIENVTMKRSTYTPPPHRFEAGTPPIAQAIGLGAAVDYLSAIGMSKIAAHEQAITAYALKRLKGIDGIRILGPDAPIDRGGAISFELADLHPHDVSQVLDSVGIAVRAGHHCAKPAHARFGITASTRASFYLYTTPQEIDVLADGLEHVKKFFRVG